MAWHGPLHCETNQDSLTLVELTGVAAAEARVGQSLKIKDFSAQYQGSAVLL